MKHNDLAEDDPGSSALEVTWTFRPRSEHQGRVKRALEPNSERRNVEAGNVPRLSRLMALAIRFAGLIRNNEVSDYADLARLGYVTRARITQIMSLLNLAPDIQEEILFLPRTTTGRDPIKERDVRPIAAVPHWHRQRKMWEKLVKDRSQTQQ